MKKILITILTLILLVFLGVLLISGISIGKIEIASINKMIADNKNLDIKIAELQTSIDTEWTTAETELSSSLKALQTAKQKYQDTITYSSEEEIQAANQTDTYEIGYLWTKIGLYATKNSVTMQATVTSSGLLGLYNISFIARGNYLDISEFIYAIEKDSNLGFRIEDFTMVPYEGDVLQSTFVIRNITIDEESLSSATTTIGETLEESSSSAEITNSEASETYVEE